MSFYEFIKSNSINSSHMLNIYSTYRGVNSPKYQRGYDKAKL